LGKYARQSPETTPAVLQEGSEPSGIAGAIPRYALRQICAPRSVNRSAVTPRVARVSQLGALRAACTRSIRCLRSTSQQRFTITLMNFLSVPASIAGTVSLAFLRLMRAQDDVRGVRWPTWPRDRCHGLPAIHMRVYGAPVPYFAYRVQRQLH
jgi:hypothetical protein